MSNQAEVWELSVLVMSDQIKPDHPFWVEMEKRGYDIYEFDGINIPSESDGFNVLLIHDTSESISIEYLRKIIDCSEKISSFPRILIAGSGDKFMHLKREVYRCDSMLEVDLQNESEMEETSYAVYETAISVDREDSEPENWEELSRLFLDDICDVDEYTNLINDIASLAPLFREYEYTVKSLLRFLASAFNSCAASLYIEDENVLYTLVAEETSKEYIKSMWDSMMNHYEAPQRDGFVEVIWGRRLVDNQSHIAGNKDDFIVIPLKVNDRSIGHVAVPANDSEKHDRHHLKLLGNQIAQLVNTSLQYKIEQKEMQKSFLRMNAVQEVCQLFSDLDSKDFGVQFLLVVLEHVSAYKGVLSLMDDSGEITEMHSVGFDENSKKWLKSDNDSLPWIETFHGDEPRSGTVNIPVKDDIREYQSLYYIGYPLYDVHKKLGVLFILFRTPPKTEEQFQHYHETMATLASILFANINLYEQFLEKRLIEEQINIARDIQQEILPKHVPKLDSFYVAASSRSATQVGGDFYDFVPMPGEKHVMIIGDVSGKGIAASQLMSMSKSLIKFRLLQNQTSLAKAMSDVNNYLAKETPSEKFITVQSVMIDQKNKSLELVNAGHRTLLIYRKEKDDFDEIDVDGMAMGILQDIMYESKKTFYSPGDIVLMFTDGLHESMSPDREQFGIERIKTITKKMADAKATEILAKFYEAINEHAAGLPQHDDTTIIVMKAK